MNPEDCEMFLSQQQLGQSWGTVKYICADYKYYAYY